MPNFIVTRLDLALARQHIFFALVPLFLVIGNSATLAALPGPVSTAAILNSNANTDSGFDDSPDMVTDGLGTWVAVWESNDTLGGTLSNGTHIFTSRSTDGGATWSALAVLGTEGLRSRIATDGNGTYIVVWAHGVYYASDFDILYTVSTDDGQTWTTPVPLDVTFASAGNTWDDDPRITTDGLGNWVVAWATQHTLSGTIGFDEDIVYSVSTNDGSSWSFPAVLDSSAFTDSGDDVLPHVATDGSGNWVAVWDSDDRLRGRFLADLRSSGSPLASSAIVMTGCPAGSVISH